MIKPKKGGKTLAEIDAEMKANGTYDAMIARQEARRREIDERVARERVAQAPLLADLRTAGFEVDTIYDLYKVKGSHAKTVPILLAHLPRPYPPAIREQIARRLTVPEMKRTLWKDLLRLYRIETDDWVKQGLINAIHDLADNEDFNDVLELIHDRTVGATRSLLLHFLDKSKDPRGKQTILDLADDPDLREEIKAIRKKWERNAIKRAQKAAQKNPTRH